MSEENVVLNGRYELIERIGSGGMSVVYKARDRALGRIVAVKMMHESFTNDKGFLKRFQQEAHSAANLAHPNIVTVHDIGQDEYKHYIVMEFVEGQTLKQIIRSYNDEPMPISRALDLIIQVCNGIGYAHRANLATDKARICGERGKGRAAGLQAGTGLLEQDLPAGDQYRCEDQEAEGRQAEPSHDQALSRKAGEPGRPERRSCRGSVPSWTRSPRAAGIER